MVFAWHTCTFMCDTLFCASKAMSDHHNYKHAHPFVIYLKTPCCPFISNGVGLDNTVGQFNNLLHK